MIDVTEWVLDPKNLEHGLYLVAIGNQRVPVSNQVCECGHGWAAPFKFAVYDNKVYHKKCLQELFSTEEFDKMVDSGNIITE